MIKLLLLAFVFNLYLMKKKIHRQEQLRLIKITKVVFLSNVRFVINIDEKNLAKLFCFINLCSFFYISTYFLNVKWKWDFVFLSPKQYYSLHKIAIPLNFLRKRMTTYKLWILCLHSLMWTRFCLDQIVRD